MLVSARRAACSVAARSVTSVLVLLPAVQDLLDELPDSLGDQGLVHALATGTAIPRMSAIPALFTSLEMILDATISSERSRVKAPVASGFSRCFARMCSITVIPIDDFTVPSSIGLYSREESVY